jgi:hypothetical protein
MSETESPEDGREDRFPFATDGDIRDKGPKKERVVSGDFGPTHHDVYDRVCGLDSSEHAQGPLDVPEV